MSHDALAGLDPCVHCGFCLQACPTFLATGDEADSPRGRIVLMQGVRHGTLSPTDADLARHLDRCLGCRGCESACPSGVSYGPALEAVRARIVRERPTPGIATLVLTVMAERRINAPLFWASRLVRPIARFLAGRSRLGFLFGMLAATGMGPRAARRHDASGTRNPSPPAAAPSGPAAVFRGCIMEGLFRHVHDATARTLEANGYRLEDVPSQGCCGALHLHAGHRDAAAALARANVRAFSAHPDAAIVVNSAGCGATLKEYAELLADDPLAEAARRFAERVRDVTEALADAGPAPGAPLDLAVAYDAPCHLQHAQRIDDPPAAILEAIPGLRRVDHQETDQCCGSAGLYGLLQPTLSGQILDRKLEAIQAAKPDLVVTGNPGCLMQLGAGLLAAGDDTPVLHPVELLDLSYRLRNGASMAQRGRDADRFDS